MNTNKFCELELVRKIGRIIKNDSSVVCGIGDDTAVLKYRKDKYLLFTADMLIEDIDFDKKAKAWEIGHKALACSLSDIAAMGGEPKYALVSLGLSKKDTKGSFFDGFYKGMLKLARRFNVNIVGGDLSFSKKKVIDVSVIGEVDKNRVVLRSGAQPKDIIFVTGALGGSIYGRHLNFTPRIKEANYLTANYKVNSMIDISDGLCLDLYRLAKASSVGAVIYEELIPVSLDAKSQSEALYMGEDFELLFTMPEYEARRLLKTRRKLFKAIGEIRDKKYDLKIITKKNKEKPLEPRGYQHF